jgi:hypothetical protein
MGLPPVNEACRGRVERCVDAERARYVTVIERRFSELRGRGFLLSPRDVALCDGWRARGVPARVVVAGLEEGARAYFAGGPSGRRLPASLGYFEDRIEDAARGWAERVGSVGGPCAEEPGSAIAARVRTVIEAQGRAQTEGTVREALREVWREAGRFDAATDPWAALRDLDQRLVDRVLAGLGPAEREELVRVAEARVALAGGAKLSPAARAERCRWELGRALREHFGLSELAEVLRE